MKLSILDICDVLYYLCFYRPMAPKKKKFNSKRLSLISDYGFTQHGLGGPIRAEKKKKLRTEIKIRSTITSAVTLLP